MRVQRYLPRRLSGLLAVDALLTGASFLLISTLYNGWNEIDFLLNYNGFDRIGIVIASLIFGLYLADLYNKVRVTSRVNLALQLFTAFGVTLMIQGVLSYTMNTLRNENYGLHLPRIMMLAGSALCFAALFGWRNFYSGVIWKWIAVERVVFIGCDEVVSQIAELMATEPERGYLVLGYLSETPERPPSPYLGKLLGTPSQAKEVVSAVRASRLIVGMLDRRGQLPIADLLEMSGTALHVDDAATSYERICGRVCSRDFRPSQFIFDAAMVSRPGSMALQSIYTNVVALVSVIAMLPFMILVAIAIRLTSRGPVLVGETRLGQYAIPFQLNRFRTWRLVAHIGGQERKTTWLGLILERLHLDRLPILFNVLRGEMALVGPTPDRPEFARQISRYVPYYPQRQIVKPGLTGWTQVNLHQSSSPDALTALEYDLYYTKHLSISLDAHILFARLRQIIAGD